MHTDLIPAEGKPICIFRSIFCNFLSLIFITCVTYNNSDLLGERITVRSPLRLMKMTVMNHITNIFLLLLLLFVVVAAFFILIMFIYMIVAKLKMIKDGRRKKLTSITL